MKKPKKISKPLLKKLGIIASAMVPFVSMAASFSQNERVASNSEGSSGASGGDTTPSPATFSWKAETDKLSDFSSTTRIDAVPRNLKTVIINTDVKTQFVAIQGYSVPTFGAGVSIKKVVVALPPQGTSTTVTYTVTLQKSGQSDTTKNVVVTFKRPAVVWATEKAKLTSFSSTKTVNTLSTGLKAVATDPTRADIKNEFIALPSYPTFTFDDRVSITKVVVSTALNNLRQVVYTVTLTNSEDNSTDTLDVTVTFAPRPAVNLENEKNLFPDFRNATTMNALHVDLITKSTKNIKTKFLGIYGSLPATLDDRVELSKVVVKTTLDRASGIVVYALTLTETGTRNTVDFDVEVTYRPELALDWATEKAKIVNLNSRTPSNSLPKDLITMGDTDIKGQFPPLPGSLDNRIMLSKIIVKTSLDRSTNAVVYTLTLRDTTSDTTQTKDVTITYQPAPTLDLAAEKAKFNDFVSTRDISTLIEQKALSLRDTVDIKDEFIKIEGYAEPANLDNRIILTKVVVKESLGFGSRSVTYTLTLTDSTTRGSETTKDVTVTYNRNWVAEIRKFKNFQTAALIDSEVTSKALNADVKTLVPNLRGYEEPDFLAKGVAIKSMVVSETFNRADKTMKFTVVIEDGVDASNEHEFTVTFSNATEAKVFDYKDFVSTTTYSALSAKLKETTNDANTKNIKADFETIAGYVAPTNVDADVSFNEVHVVAADERKRQVTYKLKFAIGATGSKTIHEKQIVVSYALDIDADAKKFNNFISTEPAAGLAAEITSKTEEDGAPKNIKNAFVAIPGYVQPASLSEDVTIKTVVVKTALKAETRAVVYTITLASGEVEKSFDITATFKADFGPERAKFQNFDSTFGVYRAVAIAPKDGADIKALFKEMGGYQAPSLASGVEIHKVVVKTILSALTRQTVYTITLWDGKNIDTATQDVTVTFAENLEAGLNQLVDFDSTANIKSAYALIKKTEANVKTTFMQIPGYQEQTFATDVVMTKVVVKEALNTTTRQVKFTVTLTAGTGESATSENKDVVVTFEPDLDAEALKFKDFMSSDDENSIAAKLPASLKDVKDIFLKIRGYIAPKLIAGVEISKIALKKVLDSSKSAVFTITLRYRNSEKQTDVTVTFKTASSASSKSLSAGEIVGIAGGSLAGLGILGFAIYYFLKRRR